MSSNLSAVNPLSYMGVRPVSPAPVTIQTRDPLTTDIRNFIISTIWVNTVAQSAYMLVANADNIAIWELITGGIANLSTITTPDTVVVEPTANNINFLNGTGIAITGSGSDVTFNATAMPFIVTWTVITSATHTLASNQGYFANRGGGVTFTLPATAAVGDVFFIASISSGAWSLQQNAGQSINFGTAVTTTGGGGSLTANNIGDSIFMVCYATNTNFIVISPQGTITVA
jgi:hypothetical protein